MGRGDGLSEAPPVVPPAFVNVPERVTSLVGRVADVADLYGRPLDGAQRIAVDAMSSVGAGGRWAALEQVILMARQNGKTAGVITPMVVDDLFLGPPDRIVWTAHLFKTARAAFEDIKNLIDNCDYLRKRVRKIRHAAGDEGIELLSGAKLDFLARAKGGGRGLGGKTLVFDEGLYLPDSITGAVFPLITARPNPRLIIGSSASVLESHYLRGLVARLRAGGPSAPAGAEWCAPGSFTDPGCVGGTRCPHAPGTPGCVLDDETLWPLGSPALGVRVQLDTLRRLRAALAWREWAREFYGWHEDADASSSRVPMGLWLGARDELSRVKDRARPVFVIDVGPDRAWTSIAVAGGRDDGRTHVGLHRRDRGDGWVVEHVEGLRRKHPAAEFAVDGASPAAALLVDLERKGLKVRRLKLAEVAQACGWLESAVRAIPARVAHRGDPIVAQALQDAAVRVVGDGGWAFTRKDSESDITPIVAVTLAGWLHADNPQVNVLRSVY